MERLGTDKRGNILGSKTSTSVSSVLSSLVGSFTAFFKDYFPKGYFKNEFIATSLMSTTLNDQNSDPKKIKFPALAIEPELLIAEGGLHPYPYYFYTYNWMHKNPRNEYFTILTDDNNEVYISTVPDRLKVRFNIRILTKGKIQAMDLAMMLARNFEPGGKFYQNGVRLKAELPKVYLKIIADHLNFDLKSINGREAFISYLKKNSQDTLNRVVDLNDGNEAFEYHYTANLLTEVTDKPTNTHSRKSKEEGISTTSFAMDVEFWIPGDFFLEILAPSEDTIPINEIDSEIYPLDERGVYFDVCVETLNIPNQLPDMKMLVLKEKFLTDNDVDIDVLPLADFLDDIFLIETLGYVRANYKNPYDVFEIIVYYGNDILDPDDYIFDWETFDLTLDKPFNNSVYHLCFYADMEEISNITEELIKLKNRKAKESTIGNTDTTNKRY